MWNLPDESTLKALPALYSTEHIPLQDKLIRLHFFIGSCDWWICEGDGDDLLWGFVILNNDYQNAEWGYISYSSLKDINIRGLEIENDLYWKVRPAREVDKIRKATMRWSNEYIQPAAEISAL